MGRVKAWCAALAMFGVAVVLWIAPGDIAEKVTHNEAWAIAAAAFGLAFVVALLTPESGAVGYRARALLLVIVGAVVALGIAYGLREPVRDAWVLGREGVPMRGTVVQTRLGVHRGKAKTTHTVEYPGGRGTFRLGASYSRGSTVALLVSPTDPSIASPGDEGDTALELLHRRTGAWGFVGAGIALICVLMALVKAYDLFAGPRARPDAPSGPADRAG